MQKYIIYNSNKTFNFEYALLKFDAAVWKCDVSIVQAWSYCVGQCDATKYTGLPKKSKPQTNYQKIL